MTTNHKTWNDDHARQATEMRRDKMLVREIAGTLGFTPETVRNMIRTIDPSLIATPTGSMENRPDTYVGGYGDLWDNREDYLQLLSDETRERLAIARGERQDNDKYRQP